MSSISVILNGYRRGDVLNEQLAAIEGQSVKPEQVLLWYNNPGHDQDPNYEIGTKIPTAYCTYNFGVWARFAFALNAESEYICVFDDDTIPGSRWLENCLNTIKDYNGLLGTIGVRFQSTNGYDPHTRVGWANPNENTEIVDIVGHSWFFKREWLATYWRELPEIGTSRLVGEDMHFSYTLQKYLGLNTYVPPHPHNDPEMWGSKPDVAWRVGRDDSAISMNYTNLHHMNNAYLDYIKKGFKLYTK